PSPLLTFLHELHRCSITSPALYNQYMSIVGNKGIALVDEIRWRMVKAPKRNFRVRAGGAVVTETRDQSIVIPTMVVRGVRLAPNQLSEGTFRSLAIIFNLLSAKGDLVLLEEPEVCVHHGLLSSIVEIMKNCSAKRQVIFSTHSDFVLDALYPESVQIVRYSPHSGTTVRKLPDAMSSRDFTALKE